MEVHHHPHTEKKGFKAYFLEFLMLFLAVFLGFLAENIRETQVEKKRVREYMLEIVSDLQYDTTRIRLNNLSTDSSALGMDSLRSELRLAIAGKVNGARLYYLEKTYAGVYGIAAFNTSAISELKSSGSVRLIQNRHIVDDMDDYYTRRLMAVESFRPSQRQSEELSAMLNEFFSWKYFDEEIATAKRQNFFSTYNFKYILTSNLPFRLLKSNPDDLERLYNAISQFEYAVKSYQFFLQYAGELAMKLISEIRKEYRFDAN